MRSKFIGVFAAVLLVLFLAALIRIATLPLEAGDVYPPYSSLRADPLGAKALFESLAALGELRVVRHFQPVTKLKGSEGAVLMLGVPASEAHAWSETELKFYESIADSGGRLVIAFLPTPPESQRREKRDKMQSTPAIAKRWHATVDTYEGTDDEIEKAGSMPRKTSAYFAPEDKSGWQVLERNERGGATLIVRAFGKGQILLLTDSYPLSNEGLRAVRPIPLIETIAGSSRRIVFDESHLGVSDTGSVGTLIRRYRLTGAFAVLLFLGLLFLWKNSTSLLPPSAEPPSAAAAAGADAQSGLVNLLKRSVPQAQLARACWERWKDTRSIGRAVGDQRVALAEQALEIAAPQETQAAVYRKIQTILTERT